MIAIDYVIEEERSPEDLPAVERIIRSRLAERGWPSAVARDGARLFVEARGVSDPAELRLLLATTGMVSLVMPRSGTIVEAGDPATEGDLIAGAADFISAEITEDQLGNSALELVLAEEAAERLRDASRESVGSQMAIVVDGEVASAPVLNSQIYDGRLQLSGADLAVHTRLAAFIEHGPLPATLQEVSFERRP